MPSRVQICLDLASAFDTVPHALVREALCEAGVAEGKASLLFAWLSSCSYDLHLSGLSASIPARRGVKQGCPASPLLFAACTVLLTRRIDLRLGCSWTSAHLTMFADDLHLAALFRTVVEFEHVCERIGVAIGILRRHGLTIHPAKAQALLTYAGFKGQTDSPTFHPTAAISGTRQRPALACGGGGDPSPPGPPGRLLGCCYILRLLLVPNIGQAPCSRPHGSCSASKGLECSKGPTLDPACTAMADHCLAVHAIWSWSLWTHRLAPGLPPDTCTQAT